MKNVDNWEVNISGYCSHVISVIEKKNTKKKIWDLTRTWLVTRTWLATRTWLVRRVNSTPGQLLNDISCHLISPRFSFAHSSCLIPSTPCLSSPVQTLSLGNNDAQNDSLSLGLVCHDAWEWTSGDNFPNRQPSFLNNGQLKGLFFQILSVLSLNTFYPLVW